SGPAVQWVRLTRTALIDQHDVPRALDLAEDRANLARQLCRALTGAAGEEHDRVEGTRPDGGQDRDPECNRATLLGVAILENRQRSAVGVGRPFVVLTGMKVVERGRRGRDLTRGRGGDD